MTLNLLHTDAACKLGQVADHALHVQCPKLGFSLVGLPGETKQLFNPQRVLLGHFLLFSVTLQGKSTWVNFLKVNSVTQENATFPRETSHLHVLPSR